MSKSNRIPGKITNIERLSSSSMGNPRFMITITSPSGVTTTQPTAVNASVAYGIENREYKEQDHVWVFDHRLMIVGVEPYVIKDGKVISQ